MAILPKNQETEMKKLIVVLVAILAIAVLVPFVGAEELCFENCTPEPIMVQGPVIIPTLTPNLVPTAMPTNAPTLQVEEPWLQNLSERDAQCASQIFGQFGIEPVNTPQLGGEDGSPSPTLALLGVLSENPSEIELDRENGRSFLFRGGEAGQIQSANGQILVVFLMDTAREFTEFWSRPEMGVIAEGGDPLASVGFESLMGRGEVTVTVYRDDVQLSLAEGTMSPSGELDTAFTRLSTINGFQQDWTPGYLAGFAVPTDLDGCFYATIQASILEQRVLSFGVGTYQLRYSRVAEIQVPTNAPTNMPTSTPTATPTGTTVQSVVVPTLAPTAAFTCPEGEVMLFDAFGNQMGCYPNQG